MTFFITLFYFSWMHQTANHSLAVHQKSQVSWVTTSHCHFYYSNPLLSFILTPNYICALLKTRYVHHNWHEIGNASTIAPTKWYIYHAHLQPIKLKYFQVCRRRILLPTSRYFQHWLSCQQRVICSFKKYLVLRVRHVCDLNQNGLQTLSDMKPHLLNPLIYTYREFICCEPFQFYTLMCRAGSRICTKREPSVEKRGGWVADRSIHVSAPDVYKQVYEMSGLMPLMLCCVFCSDAWKKRAALLVYACSVNRLHMDTRTWN